MLSRGRSCVLALLWSCGPSVQDQELRAMRHTLHELQSQVARMDARVEQLSHRVVLLSDRGEASRAAPKQPQPKLEVVKLAPAVADEEDEPAGPVVEIRLDESAGVPALAVVDVPPPPVVAPEVADRLFKKALAAYQSGRAAEAFGHFQSFVREHPRHEHAANAQYWMGECQIELGKYDLAVAELTRVVERYPKSSKAPDAMMKIGIAYERQGKSDAARRSFQKVIDGYPGSALADLARARLASR